MPVTPATLQTLLSVVLSTASTANSQATHGAAVSPAIGGSFTVGVRTTVLVNVEIPFMSVPTATSVELHVLIDGVCIGEIFVFCWSASVGTPVSRTIPVTLTTGVHTIALNLKTGAGVGTLAMTAVTQGLLQVVES